MKNITKSAILSALEARKVKTQKNKAIMDVAFMILENVDDLSGVETREQLHAALLNGADSWEAYVYGGNLLCYDRQIASLLFSEKNMSKEAAKGSEYLLDKLVEVAKSACDCITTAAFHGSRYWK